MDPHTAPASTVGHDAHGAHAYGDHGHAGPTFNAYLVVFGALLIFTLVSFVVNWAVRHEHMGPHTGFTVILAVAVCKAVLVGTYFMHLILDWKRFYFVIIPVSILGALLIVVLLPDIVLAWHGPAMH